MKCPTCGIELGTKSNISSDERSMKAHGECFICSLWRERLPLVGNPDVAIIDGTLYTIDDENAPGQRGFGGAKFVINFKDGRKITTTNLYCGGHISEYWKPQFPDNADFDWQWKKIGRCNYLVPKKKEETNIEMLYLVLKINNNMEYRVIVGFEVHKFNIYSQALQFKLEHPKSKLYQKVL